MIMARTEQIAKKGRVRRRRRVHDGWKQSVVCFLSIREGGRVVIENSIRNIDRIIHSKV